MRSLSKLLLPDWFMMYMNMRSIRNGRAGASGLLMIVFVILVAASMPMATGTARESRELKPIKHSV